MGYRKLWIIDESLADMMCKIKIHSENRYCSRDNCCEKCMCSDLMEEKRPIKLFSVEKKKSKIICDFECEVNVRRINNIDI